VAGDAPRVSVVIPTFDKADLLAATLDALDAQTYPRELTEVVVVDDHSPDRTEQLLNSLAPGFALRGLRHETNRGRAAARNTGVRAAKGDLVVFLDDDMRADRRLVEEHARFHATRERAAAIGKAVTAPDLGRSLALSYLDTRGVQKLAPGSRAPARYFLTNNSSVPRQALLDAGLFDESFRSYGFEDMDIAYRLERDAGLSFWYCAGAVAHHIHHHTLEQLLDKRLEAARTTLPRLLEKHPGRVADLSLEALLPPAPGDRFALRAMKTLVRVLTAAPLERSALAVAAAAAPGRAAYRLLDYLVACRYRRGLAEASEAAAGRRS
jgi:glycosyltransferase involved in cell wall biosynthesis